ncbi:MAG: hypothetical protein L6Q84_29070 [Polyangiaceae bacterium]|nr:hypothetical protein [Polyangiaceae bacterium]
MYSKLRCASLQASFGDDVVPAARSDKPTALDPTLGWSEKLENLGGMCARQDTGNAVYCDALRRYALRHTAFQERPLDGLGVEEAFRGLYDHSLGAAVLVRAVRFDGQFFLVAKVLERGPGPLAWITSRRLSGAEWASLERAAAVLPKGRTEYYPRVRPEPRTAASEPACVREDGASVQIEHLRGGVVQVSSGTYEQRSRMPYSDRRCRDSHSEAMSRFFDRLLELVECAQSAPVK